MKFNTLIQNEQYVIIELVGRGINFRIEVVKDSSKGNEVGISRKETNRDWFNRCRVIEEKREISIERNFSRQARQSSSVGGGYRFGLKVISQDYVSLCSQKVNTYTNAKFMTQIIFNSVHS
jgi:hypothetical protein